MTDVEGPYDVNELVETLSGGSVFITYIGACGPSVLMTVRGKDNDLSLEQARAIRDALSVAIGDMEIPPGDREPRAGEVWKFWGTTGPAREVVIGPDGEHPDTVYRQFIRLTIDEEE